MLRTTSEIRIFLTMLDTSAITAAIIICFCQQALTKILHKQNIMDKQWTVFWLTHLLLHTQVVEVDYNMTKPKKKSIKGAA